MKRCSGGSEGDNNKKENQVKEVKLEKRETKEKRNGYNREEGRNETRRKGVGAAIQTI